jgi:hypothetical protein
MGSSVCPFGVLGRLTSACSGCRHAPPCHQNFTAQTQNEQLNCRFDGFTGAVLMTSLSLFNFYVKHLAPGLASAYIGALRLMLPVAPMCASLVFGRLQYLRDYAGFVRKLRIHIDALREGPARHYFEDVFGRAKAVPADITGSCVQCGNCCMDKRCVFLEALADGRYQCGIYNSPLRRLSNCGSFPLNAKDIARYACPSYQVIEIVRQPTFARH